MTTKALQQRLKLGITGREVHRRLGAPDKVLTAAYPRGYHEEAEKYYCADGDVIIDYGVLEWAKGVDSARIVYILGPHGVSGDASVSAFS